MNESLNTYLNLGQLTYLSITVIHGLGEGSSPHLRFHGLDTPYLRFVILGSKT